MMVEAVALDVPTRLSCLDSLDVLHCSYSYINAIYREIHREIDIMNFYDKLQLK